MGVRFLSRAPFESFEQPRSLVNTGTLEAGL
jgi:hypothetical protein